MSSALFILIGLGLVGAAIWFGNRPGSSPRSPSDAWDFSSPNRTSPPDGLGCDPADRDGDGEPDRTDDNDGLDSDGDGADADGGDGGSDSSSD